MHAHPVEISQTHTNPRPAPLVSGSVVTAVGTFAAETGSFASGLSETAPSITA
jgi:hypothetical protein